ncbi:hypothetical protein M413DRAFT_244137 [Hebeloma cylindrosporum]|uniref:Uncharacterized protein n=1 Tax=Hebeloma cylindrosporum TaxID=76867 RepID=A0A0C2YBA4_HEBCY|nr:hypothetical protein M413DRAFT_244137 [Hebeloma cylindrosporum h7]
MNRFLARNGKKRVWWKQTYLRPSNVWGNEEFDVSVSENPQYHPPEIPLSKATPAFEELGRSFFLTLFILCPRVATVFACVDVFCVVLLLPPFVWEKTGKDEDGLDTQLFEST